ncbi:hypothetical protein GCM10008942_10670 [Rhizomicrobium electricum]|uniref:Uncharacterized protein n=1 Tax=Rhizomicrobium electricum TaxID=480070 RepID=A0ABP3PBD0_9PROT
MLHTRTLAGSFVLDGENYEWELRREPQWCTADGWQGMQIAVRAVDAGGCEALLQFPMPKKLKARARGYRHRPQIQQAELDAAVRTALSSGWNPHARGKPFQVDV